MIQMKTLYNFARQHFIRPILARRYSSLMNDNVHRVKHKAMVNVDLGEGYGNWTCGPDPEILLPLIDHANIACGFHAS